MNRLLETLLFLWRRVYLIFYLGKKHFWRSLFSSLGLFLTLSIVILILGILRPVKEMLVKKMEGSLPSEMIRLTAPDKQVMRNPFAIFQADKDTLLGVTTDEINKIKTWPEVKKLYVTQVLQRPGMASIDHPLINQLGFKFYFDVMFQGVNRELVRPYLHCMKDFRVEKDTDENGNPINVIPLVVPETFAEIAYTYAMINGLPDFKPKDLLGLRLKIRLGESTLGIRSKDAESAIGKVCGFVPQGLVSAAGAPFDFVREQHLRRKQRNALNSFDQIFLLVENPKDIPAVQKKAKAMGLSFPLQSKKYNEIYKALEKLDYLFWTIAIVLLMLTSISLANSFMLLAIEKKYEFGLYLVFGASPLFLWLLMFVEGAFWGFFHSGLSLYAADGLFLYLQNHLADIPFLSKIDIGGWENIRLEISRSEQFAIVAGATVFAGISSLAPAIILLGRKTLELVKKD